MEPTGTAPAAPARDASAADAEGDELGITVALEQFSGPMDLLLYLVKRHEVPIQELPIAAIADQFAAWVASQAGRLDLDRAGDFVVMAAALLELKARAVAPPPAAPRGNDDEELEFLDPRAGLIRRLLAFRAAKEAAVALERREERQRLMFPRGWRESIPNDPQELEAWDLGDVGVGTLAELWFGLLERLDALAPRTVVIDDVPMPQRVEQVLAAMRERGEGRLDELLAAERSRVGRVGILLAILECARQRFLEVQQAGLFGPVRLRFRPEEERAIPAGDPGPPEVWPKRARRPPLVTWHGRTVEGEEPLPEEPPPESEEQRFQRELEEALQLETTLARIADLERGFVAWWQERHPGEPLPPWLAPADAAAQTTAAAPPGSADARDAPQAVARAGDEGRAPAATTPGERSAPREPAAATGTTAHAATPAAEAPNAFAAETDTADRGPGSAEPQPQAPQRGGEPPAARDGAAAAAADGAPSSLPPPTAAGGDTAPPAAAHLPASATEPDTPPSAAEPHAPPAVQADSREPADHALNAGVAASDAATDTAAPAEAHAVAVPAADAVPAEPCTADRTPQPGAAPDSAVAPLAPHRDDAHAVMPSSAGSSDADLAPSAAPSAAPDEPPTAGAADAVPDAAPADAGEPPLVAPPAAERPAPLVGAAACAAPSDAPPTAPAALGELPEVAAAQAAPSDALPSHAEPPPGPPAPELAPPHTPPPADPAMSYQTAAPPSPSATARRWPRRLALAACWALSTALIAWWAWQPRDVLQIEGPADPIPRDAPLVWTLNLPLDPEERARWPLPTANQPGRFAWRDERTLVFTPEPELPPAAALTVRFPELRARGGFHWPRREPPTVTLHTLPAIAVTALAVEHPPFGEPVITLTLSRAPADPLAVLDAVRSSPALPLRATLAGTVLELTAPCPAHTTLQLALQPAGGRADDRPAPWQATVQIPPRQPGARLVPGLGREAWIEVVNSPWIAIARADGSRRAWLPCEPVPDQPVRLPLPPQLLDGPGQHTLLLRWAGGEATAVLTVSALPLGTADAARLLIDGRLPVVSVP